MVMAATILFIVILMSFSVVNGFTFDETCIGWGDAPNGFSPIVTVPLGTDKIVGNVNPSSDLDNYRFYLQFNSYCDSCDYWRRLISQSNVDIV